MIQDWIDEVLLKAEVIRKKLASDATNQISNSPSHIPRPYSKAISPSKVKLIIVGQDPTVRNVHARMKIQHVLNLDKTNSLRKYLASKLCSELNIDLDTEVYTTNLFKCFYNFPPADAMEILHRHSELWLSLLKVELDYFKNAKVIALGQPLLRVLIGNRQNKNVRHYWGYKEGVDDVGEFSLVDAGNLIARPFYPFPHQPAYSRNKFYRKYFAMY